MSSSSIDSSRRSMNIVDDADGPLDPRIQIELEKLNNATDDINKLEIELDEANTIYGQLLSETTSCLKELMNKLGTSCIDKARCYFEACEVARQARIKCQNQAQQYHRLNDEHALAKETAVLAEKRFMSNKNEWNFDQTWQDVLNHSILRVMELENQKAECAREHQKRTLLFHEAEKKVKQLEEKYRRSIQKAQPYFDLKVQLDQKLAMQKEAVECLKKSVKDAKCYYAASLRALEEISNQIHEKRRDYDIVANGPREPGVGAELVTSEESLNYEDELNKIRISRVNSVASSEPDYDDRSQDFEDIKDLKRRVDNLSARSVDGSESNSDQWELELQASVEKLNKLPFNVCESDKLDSVNKYVSKSSEVLKINPNSDNEKFDKNVQFEQKKQNDDSLQSWQSLAQSPIHSFINRSKIAFKNSFSKSLTSSPVNVKKFSFGKSKSLDSETVPEQRKTIDQSQTDLNLKERDTFVDLAKNNNQTIEDIAETTRIPNQKDYHGIQNNNLSNQTSFQNNSNNICVEDLNRKKLPETLSLNSTPVRSKDLATSNFTHNNNYSDGSSSKTKELPLLSFFHKSMTPTKDKSCSMINLNEKSNLKTLLDNTTLGNIQAVSVEKLADLRHKLVGES